MKKAHAPEQVPVRQYWIDAAKAICISLIVFYHECGMYFPDTVRFLSSIPVPVFVFLAGYQLSRRALNGSASDFFQRNCMRIVVVFFSLGLLTYIPWWLKNQFIIGEAYAESGPWLPLFGMFYGASGPNEWITHNVPLWFLSFTVSILLAYYFVFRAAKTPLVALGASLAVYALGAALVPNLTNRLPWNIDLAMIGLPFFALGYVAKVYRVDLIVARTGVSAVLLPLAIVINYLAMPHPQHIDLNVGKLGDPLLLLLDGVSGILIAVIIAIHLPRLHVLEVVGRNALIIFALHSLTGIVFNMGLAAVLGDAADAAHGWLTVVAAVVIFNNAACILLGIPIRKYMPWALGGRRRRARQEGAELSAV
jgi:fucose 4-O-acetylase-like acetyltransferase